MSRMNAGFILGGQQPDIVNTLARADAARAAKENQQYQVDYRNALQTHGAGALRGEQGAINALAGFDPAAMQGLETGRLNQQATRQRMAVLSAQEARAIQAHAASMTAAERQAQAQRIEQGVAMGLAAQTPEQWDQVVGQMAPELVGQFENREMLANRYRSIADIMKSMEAPTEPAAMQTLRARAAAAGLQEGTPQYARFMATGGRETPTLRVTQTPEGGLSVTQGAGDFSELDGVKFTEQQSKDNVYATRARGALDALEPVAGTLTSASNRALEYDPTGLTRNLQDDDFQVAMQAGLEFLQAILRKDTGAAITEPEVNSYGKTYLPQVGDGPAVLEAKREARIRAINALESGMSATQMLARDRALIRAAEETSQGGGETVGRRTAARGEDQSQNPYTGISEEEFRALDLTTLSAEEIDLLFEARQP